jgi:hypothetical protein
MIRQIIIAIVASAFIGSIAFGQMKYSRSRSASPTPTPTPAQLIPAQKVTTAPRITATPMQPKVMPTPPAAGQAKPTPAPRMKSMQSPTPSQRMTSTAIQARPAATPLPVVVKPMPTPSAPGQAKPTPLPRMMSMQSPTPSQRMTSTTIQARPAATPVPVVVKPTPTPVPPPDVKAYLDRQVASSKDQKFHMTINGKDLPMTPFHVWRQKGAGPNMTSTCVDMRGDDGRVYDIDFVTTGAQVSGIRIHKINGESLR